jgi:two-component system phosphate regulon sensor histidine kinase PhoR
MFPTKNLSPQQLSATTALIIAVPISIGIYFFEPIWWYRNFFYTNFCR